MINLGFLTKGKSCCYIHHTFLLGFPMGWSSTTHQRQKDPSLGEVSDEEVVLEEVGKVSRASRRCI
jgi:hypothetical protein